MIHHQFVKTTKIYHLILELNQHLIVTSGMMLMNEMDFKILISDKYLIKTYYYINLSNTIIFGLEQRRKGKDKIF